MRTPEWMGGTGRGETRAGGRAAAARVLGVLTALLVVAVPISLDLAPSALASGTGSITGTVTEFSAPHSPIEGIEVCTSPVNTENVGPESFKCEKTGSMGRYTITGLPSGEYDVQFSPPNDSSLNYIPQYYNGKSLFQEATTVFVAAGPPTPNIDAELEEGGRISGTVRNASTHTGIKGIEVCAFAESIESYKCATTETSGGYTIAGLSKGEYDVEFASPFSPLEQGLDYVPQYWNDKPLASEANAVAVAVGNTVSNIDAQLEEGGHITGKVTNASTGAAIENVLVCASTKSGESALGDCAITSSGGEYTISALASGSYTVKFNAGKNYVVQYYNDKSSAAESNSVSVTAPDTTSGIDAAMQLTSAPPVNTTPPVVSGTPAVGSTLLCAPGLWTGKPPPAFIYQWLRNGAPIAGANATGYTVQSADAGNTISCQVVAKNSAGEKSARSAGVAIPANPVSSPPSLPPPPTPKIAIAGSKVVVSGGSATVHIACSDAACSGSAELTLRITVKRRRGEKTVSRKQTLVLAKGTYSLAEGRSATVVMRLTAAGRQRFARVKRHPLTVRLTVSVTHGRATVRSVRVS